MKAVINILRVILAVVLCLVIAFNVWVLFQQTVLGKSAPEVFGYSLFTVQTGSMEPTISAGDMILVHREEEYALGDIVTFETGGMPVTHRIVVRTEGMFVTKGDANNTEDSELLAPERIVGKLRVVLPGVGKAVDFFHTPMGLLILVLVVLPAAFVLFALPDWIGSSRAGGREKHGKRYR